MNVNDIARELLQSHQMRHLREAADFASDIIKQALNENQRLVNLTRKRK